MDLWVFRLLQEGNVPIFSSVGVMENSELSCPVCGERFTDSSVPRNLGCGHTFCTSCVQQMITRDRRCPECRLFFTSTAAVELPVNYPLLRLARSSLVPSGLRSTSTGREPDAGECRSHEANMYFWCETCRKYVCRDCLVLDHKPAPLGSCKILSISQGIEKTKISQLEKSTAAGHLMREIKLSISKHLSKLENKKDERKNAQEQLRLKAQEEEEKIQMIEREKEEAVEKLTEIDGLLESLKLKEDAIMKSKTMQEVNRSVQESGEVLIVAGVFEAMEKSRQMKSLATVLNYGTQVCGDELKKTHFYVLIV